MGTTNRTGLLKLILFVGAVGAVLWWTGVLLPGDGKDAAADAGAIEPVKAAATRAEAIKLAQDEDLPAIARATKVVIKYMDVVKMQNHEVTVESAAALKNIRGALTITQNEPAGGSIKPYTLTFYRGNDAVRVVSVHIDGKWGVQRPGGYWILGTNAQLVGLLNRLLAQGG